MSESEMEREPEMPLVTLAAQDGRYPPEAFAFVMDALSHTIRRLGRDEKPVDSSERHISGPELLSGIEETARRRYGALAPGLFEAWGIHSTGDFGQIVFALVEGRLLRSQEGDRPEDFEDGFDFQEAFVGSEDLDLSAGPEAEL